MKLNIRFPQEKSDEPGSDNDRIATLRIWTCILRQACEAQSALQSHPILPGLSYKPESDPENLDLKFYKLKTLILLG